MEFTRAPRWWYIIRGGLSNVIIRKQQQKKKSVALKQLKKGIKYSETGFYPKRTNSIGYCIQISDYVNITNTNGYRFITIWLFNVEPNTVLSIITNNDYEIYTTSFYKDLKDDKRMKSIGFYNQLIMDPTIRYNIMVVNELIIFQSLNKRWTKNGVVDGNE